MMEQMVRILKPKSFIFYLWNLAQFLPSIDLSQLLLIFSRFLLHLSCQSETDFSQGPYLQFTLALKIDNSPSKNKILNILENLCTIGLKSWTKISYQHNQDLCSKNSCIILQIASIKVESAMEELWMSFHMITPCRTKFKKYFLKTIIIQKLKCKRLHAGFQNKEFMLLIL